MCRLWRIICKARLGGHLLRQEICYALPAAKDFTRLLIAGRTHIPERKRSLVRTHSQERMRSHNQ